MYCFDPQGQTFEKDGMKQGKGRGRAGEDEVYEISINLILCRRASPIVLGDVIL